MKKQRASRVWVPSGVVCDVLEISQNHLARLREEGLLKEGKHYRNIARPNAARPTYRYHIKLTEQVLALPKEHRG